MNTYFLPHHKNTISAAPIAQGFKKLLKISILLDILKRLKKECIMNERDGINTILPLIVYIITLQLKIDYLKIGTPLDIFCHLKILILTNSFTNYPIQIYQLI